MDAPPTHTLLQHAVLFLEILDHVQLMAVDPPGEHQEEQLKRQKQCRHCSRVYRFSCNTGYFDRDEVVSFRCRPYASAIAHSGEHKEAWGFKPPRIRVNSVGYCPSPAFVTNTPHFLMLS
jgi:hypothetical protein